MDRNLSPAIAAWRLMLVALLCAAWTPAVRADPEQGLTFSASQTVAHDSNLFRLPDAADPLLVLGRPDRSERWSITSARLRYLKDFSLQRVDIDIGLADYRYQEASNLDLLAKNYTLEWAWAVTPALRGRLRSERATTVGDLADATNPNAPSERLRRVDLFDTVYQIDGVWSLLGSSQQKRDQSEQVLRGEESTVLRFGEIGLRYRPRSGNSITARWREGNGDVLRNSSGSGFLRDDQFTQREQWLDVQWNPTAKLASTLSLGRIDRGYERIAVRDFAGTNTLLNLRWQTTAKTQWGLRWASEIGGFQTDQSSSVTTQTLGLNFGWQIAPRTSLLIDTSAARRRYGGTLPGQPANELRDTTRDSSIGLRWSISPQFQLETQLASTRRKSTQPSQSFSSLRSSISLSAGF